MITAKYQHLALAQVQPGMILSHELLDLQGHVLLPRGTTLTQKMLTAMPHHGIEMLPILEPETASKEERTADRERRQQRLARLFRKMDPASDGDWATAQLQRFVADFCVGTESPE